MIEVARVYDRPHQKSPNSSSRYLVERLWPRGIKKESLHLDAWLKDVAPSQRLRVWYGHKLERWPEFRRRYLAELRANFAAQKGPSGRRSVEPGGLVALLEAIRRGDVTLLYSARDNEHNSAIVLRDFLISKLKR
ncbi:MAG TPA: DUF488 family protein [Candidatus Acidoferrales bacterium]|nr:DUF488 family protein [Candidatus Acidoferrales bacterium]